MKAKLYDVSVVFNGDWANIGVTVKDRQNGLHSTNLSISNQKEPHEFVSKMLDELGCPFKELTFDNLERLDKPLSDSELDTQSFYDIKVEGNNKFSSLRKIRD